MISSIFIPEVYVGLAGGLYILGYLIIHQLMMRLVLLLGSFAYIAYYATVAAEPLWSAIYLTVVMVGANLLGMAGLVLRNAKIAVPREFEDIYPDFAPLRPGEFRALMKLAKRHTLQQQTTLSREGATMDRIYYVVSGVPEVTKMGATFPLAERIFVGEVAYLTAKGSAATTRVPAGAEVLEWNLKNLRQVAARRPQVKLALDAVISRDLARKVALAVAPAARHVATIQQNADAAE